jgi:hypothetical protein
MTITSPMGSATPFPIRGTACATGLTPQREWASARSSIEGITELAYTYDFGDDWRHKITIEATAAADPTTDYPRYIDGPR